MAPTWTRKRAREELGIRSFAGAPKRVPLSQAWVHERAALEHGSVDAARANVRRHADMRVRMAEFDTELGALARGLRLVGRVPGFSHLHTSDEVLLSSSVGNSMFTDQRRGEMMRHFCGDGPSPAAAIVADFAARELRADAVMRLLETTGLRPAMHFDIQFRAVRPAGDVAVRLLTSVPRPMALTEKHLDVFRLFGVEPPSPAGPVTDRQADVLIVLRVMPPLNGLRFMDEADLLREFAPVAADVAGMLLHLSDHVNRGIPRRPLADFLSTGADVVPWLPEWTPAVHTAASSSAHRLRVRAFLLSLRRVADLPNELVIRIVYHVT